MKKIIKKGQPFLNTCNIDCNDLVETNVTNMANKHCYT